MVTYWGDGLHSAIYLAGSAQPHLFHSIPLPYFPTPSLDFPSNKGAQTLAFSNYKNQKYRWRVAKIQRKPRNLPNPAKLSMNASKTLEIGEIPNVFRFGYFGADERGLKL